MPASINIHPEKPLLIVDVDEVLALFFQGFGRFVAQNGLELRCDRFALFGNLYRPGGTEAVEIELGKSLFDAFFASGGDLIEPAPGAAEALAGLAAQAQVVILTNAPAHGRDERARWLKRHAMDYPFVVNAGPKGPAIAHLAGRTTGRAAFVDDIITHLDSCATDAPAVARFQTVADERLRPLAPSWPERHTRIDGWDKLRPAIEAAILA